MNVNYSYLNIIANKHHYNTKLKKTKVLLDYMILCDILSSLKEFSAILMHFPDKLLCHLPGGMSDLKTSFQTVCCC